MTQYGLTPEQDRCLGVIRRYAVDGRVPTYDEMRVELGLASKSGVNRLVVALEERGRIVRMPNRQRSIRLVDTPPPVPVSAPVPAAWMAAGTVLRPVFADEDDCRAFVGEFGGRAVPLYEHPPAPDDADVSGRGAPWARPRKQWRARHAR